MSAAGSQSVCIPIAGASQLTCTASRVHAVAIAGTSVSRPSYQRMHA
jgi:hypothetical protein